MAKIVINGEEVKKDDIWRSRGGDLVEITAIDNQQSSYPIIGIFTITKRHSSWTAAGLEYMNGISSNDLVNLIRRGSEPELDSLDYFRYILGRF